MTMDLLAEMGIALREAILGLAATLVIDWVPGFVSMLLMLATAALVLWFGIVTYRRRNAIAWATKHICKAHDRAEFAAQFLAIDDALSHPAKGGPRQAISTAWMEYRETIFSGPDTPVMCNSVRPSSFIDSEDLGFGAATWRMWPGLLVSLGLLLTFLGLIAALGAISDGDLTDDSLKALLAAASAKFIMSLTGLACSIVLTAWLKLGAGIIEDALRTLNHAIEKRLKFESAEGIALRQLREGMEQTKSIKGIAGEIVSALDKPLSEALPAAIGASIQREMAPILDRIQQDNSTGVGDMVGQISDRLSGDIGQALAGGAARLGEAAEMLAQTAERMEGGGGRMGAQMEAGSERLLSVMTEALDAIRQNTADGADAIRSAATEMRSAADGFRAAIEGAAGQGAEVAGEGMRAAAEAARARIGDAAEQVSDPLSALAARLQAAAEATRGSAETMERMSAQVRDGGAAIERGAGHMQAAGEMAARAAAPLGGGIAQMQRATDDLATAMGRALEGVAESNRETAERTRDALQAASGVLGEGHAGTKATLEAVNIALAELTRQAACIDDIDTKLGGAMLQYRTAVEASMDGTRQRVDDIVHALGPALQTMEAVVSKAEAFLPASARPRSPAPI